MNLKNYKPISREVALKSVNLAVLREFKSKQSASKEAGATPLPGTLADGFPAMETKIERFNVRPMVAADWCVLQKLNSPIIAQAIESAKPEAERKDISILLEDMIAAVYVFTRPASQSYNLLCKEGPEALKAQAMTEIGDKVGMEMITQMFQAAQGKVPQAFETTVAYGADTEAKGDKHFFSEATLRPVTV